MFYFGAYLIIYFEADFIIYYVYNRSTMDKNFLLYTT